MPDTSGLLSHVYVTLDGADASEEFMLDLLEVTVESSLHLPDVATLVLHDPRLKWIDDASLEPGVTLEIAAKTGLAQRVIFDGEIVEIEPDFSASTQRLVVRAFDRLHRLSRGRFVRTFQQVSDGDLVQKVAQEVGLQARVGPTSQVHDYVLQNNQTNLEFLRQRAASLGYLLYVSGKTLHCEPPEPNGQEVELEWGETLTEFHPRMTTVGQVNGVLVRGWDPVNRQEIVGQARNGNGAPAVGQTRSGGDLARSAFNLEAQSLITDRAIRTQAAADRLAQAIADRTASGFIEADAVCSGNPEIVAGAAVRIKSVGNRFSGTYFVTGATHLYSHDQGYVTHFSVSGHQPATLLSLLVPEPERPAAIGLSVGIVTDNNDPEGKGRVKVKLPSLSGDQASNWARVVAPGGGPERGIEFLPEVNDEVLVGFEMGDVHYPYVIGGLWNGLDAPPKPSDQIVSGGKVQERTIRTRSGHQITFDDADGGGGITIEDRNGNKIVFDSAANSLTLEIQGNVEVKAGGKLTLSAQGQVEIKGIGVSIDGGAANVDVKGLIINLN